MLAGAALNSEEEVDPVIDDELQAAYEERGVPTDWMEVTPEPMAPAFRLWFRALRSPGMSDGQIDAGAEAELLIHDPVAALRAAGILPDTDETPRISTMVVNHDKTLKRFIMFAMVVVSTNPSTVGMTVVKEELPTRA
jgi:hypothetical protein